MAEISVENIKQYEQVFGRAKMQRLWLEFIDDAKQKLADVELRDQEGQRLAFHSLRSSGLVFGMTDFSAFCQTTEEDILKGNLIGQEQAAQAQRLFCESAAEVEAYLGK